MTSREVGGSILWRVELLGREAGPFAALRMTKNWEGRSLRSG